MRHFAIAEFREYDGTEVTRGIVNGIDPYSQVYVAAALVGSGTARTLHTVTVSGTFTSRRSSSPA
jgi:hypothetical protein